MYNGGGPSKMYNGGGAPHKMYNGGGPSKMYNGGRGPLKNVQWGGTLKNVQWWEGGLQKMYNGGTLKNVQISTYKLLSNNKTWDLPYYPHPLLFHINRCWTKSVGPPLLPSPPPFSTMIYKSMKHASKKFLSLTKVEVKARDLMMDADI